MTAVCQSTLRNLLLAAIVPIAVLSRFDTAQAQLRIVSYNTAGGPRTGMDVILEAIGEENVNGIARPIDVLLLQEQNSWGTTTTSIVGLLNTIYGANTYSLVELDGDTEGAGRPGLIYKNSTIQVVGSTAFGTVGLNDQARQTLRYQLHPIGYDSSYDFYAYNSHYKASDELTDEQRRLVEATSIRADADALGAGKHLIFAGDHNMYTSSEPAFQALIAPGAGQANDPINRLGDWHSSPAFADIHTQAPCLTGCSLTDGGMDDRFDFQLISGELMDGVGLDYLQGSYRAFGNGGNVFNNNVNAGCSGPGGCINDYAFTDVISHSKKDILDALHSVSDHLPVVADYTFTGSAPPPVPQPITQWTFEPGTPGNPPGGAGCGSSPNPACPTGATITDISATTGTGTASGVHASASTVWSNPAGNGSAESLSSNRWATDDYYQFQVSTEGFEDIILSFDHAGSSTGPRDFRIDYSTNGSIFTSTDETYSVRASANPIEWNSTTYRPEHAFYFDLSDIAALNDEETLFFRLVVNSGTAINGSGIATAGTSRVDNVTILGIEIPGLDGDFNLDGLVDAADYVMWRKTNSGDMIAYNTWVAHFGESIGGSGASAPANAPEPGTLSLTTVFTGCLLAARRGKLAGWTRRR